MNSKIIIGVAAALILGLFLWLLISEKSNTSDLTAELAQANKKILRLENSLSDQQQQAERDKRNYQAELNTIKQDKTKAEDGLRTSARDISRLQGDISRLTADLEANAKSADNHKNRLDLCEKQGQELIETKNRLDQVTAELEETIQSLALAEACLETAPVEESSLIVVRRESPSPPEGEQVSLEEIAELEAKINAAEATAKDASASNQTVAPAAAPKGETLGQPDSGAPQTETPPDAPIRTSSELEALRAELVRAKTRITELESELATATEELKKKAGSLIN